MIAVLVTAIVALTAVFAWWRFYFFHRNPARVIPSGARPLSPADGRILYVEDVSLGAETSNVYHRRVRDAFSVRGEWTVVATYLSIFDAHFVRAPIAGRVRLRHVEPVGDNASMGGSFIFAALRRPLPLSHRGYADKNEFLGVSIEGEMTVMLVLMADWWIDQIITLVADGDRVERGQVIGKIQMGSQVDLWLRKTEFGARPAAGDPVRAGETVIA